MARPGIMLYFDILDPIRMLPDEDKGRLLVAMLEYGQSGVLPEFSGMMAMAWGFIRPKLDKDGEAYENSTLQRKYATFCRSRPKNLPKITFGEWLKMTEDERERALTDINDPQRPVESVNGPYPTSTTSPSTSSNAITSVAAAADTSKTASVEDWSAAEKKLRYLNGELGKGVVVLSEFQVDILLEKLGIEMFDYYVCKLANYINNGATVKSHYNTILKWWTEDSAY